MSQIGNAVATQDRSVVNLVPQYRAEFSEVLPVHIKPDTFIRLAQGQLRKNAELRKAAERDPASFIYALREAARLGHEPGSDAFYLVPLGGKVEGWEGYRGVIERIYRAGAATSVKAEIVRANDSFEYDPAEDDRPRHKVDWFGTRGEIIGAYAYAVMQGGGTSKVVVIDRDYIEKVKRESKTSGRSDSPWQKWDEAMVLKTVIHRLEPFVPTSSEYMKERMRVAQEVAAEVRPPFVPLPEPFVPLAEPVVNTETGEVIEGQVVEPPGWEPEP